ncbi:MAG: endonuclease/exonuclease/phosphatase family protein [Ignavibacteriales bacterium]|nr:endonuclease/exonuclease/phosphatase family protein [Ignavibacteriales bacterium]
MNNKRLSRLVQFAVSSIVILFLIATVLTQTAYAQKNSSHDIKVMTFNIRLGIVDDGENSWKHRSENLFQTIEKFNPELLGLQEAFLFQIDEILKHFPDLALVGVGRDDGKQGGEYSCILYNKTRFKVDTTETFWFSDTPNIPGSKHWGNNITRICTWAKFTDSKTKNKFYYYNVHLDHESQPSREKSTELLLAKMNKQKEKLPIILTGDFNCGDDNPAILTILKGGLVDSYRALHKKTANEGTFHAFKGGTDGEKIDFIFTSNHLKTKKAEIIRDSHNGKFPSDHFPVIAVLEF